MHNRPEWSPGAAMIAPVTREPTTRRQVLARTAAAGVAVATAGEIGPWTGTAAARGAAHAVDDPPLSRGDYWDFADWIQPAFDHAWEQRKGRGYHVDTRVDALLLGTHALAALDDHRGPTRNDARARRLVDRLLTQPIWVPSRGAGGTGPRDPQSHTQDHTPGWRALGPQHVAIDPKIAESLAHAWRARRRLGLSARQVTRIERAVWAVARGVFFRYPNMRLNQANWYTGLALSAAEVTGNHAIVRGDVRRQLVRFLRGATHATPPWRIPNYSESWSYHRAPFSPVSGHENVESLEYANIVLELLLHERQARRMGMAALGSREHAILRAIAMRAVPAYWTHSGYPNWDTGMYLQRWHAGAYWGFSLQGLFAVAMAPPGDSGDTGGWAKWIFDRALATYARMAGTRGSRAPVNPVFPVHSTMGTGTSVFAARFQHQAARAAWMDLGARRAVKPPPLYAYDPRIGRLAVSTPHYNTAVMAVSNGAFPYGGLEPARLFDGDQRVASGIGGAGSGAFGITVANGAGRIVLRTQQPIRALPSAARPPLDLLRSPRGHIRAGIAYPRTPYAGAFGDLEVTAVRVGGNVRVRSTHRFRSTHIVSRWSAVRHGAARRDVVAHFPTWGAHAVVRARMRDGTTTTVARAGRIHRPIALADVRWLHLEAGGDGGGYVLVVRRAPTGTVLAAGRPPAGSSNPSPGPTVILRVTPRAAWRRLTVEVAYTPAASLARAEELAPGLRAG